MGSQLVLNNSIDEKSATHSSDTKTLFADYLKREYVFVTQQTNVLSKYNKKHIKNTL